jgi:hypothetical protein
MHGPVLLTHRIPSIPAGRVASISITGRPLTGDTSAKASLCSFHESGAGREVASFSSRVRGWVCSCAIDCAWVIVAALAMRCQELLFGRAYFAVAASSLLSIVLISGLDMKLFHTRPVR